MRQFLVNSVAALFLGAITAFTEYKPTKEITEEVETLPTSPTTEQLLMSTDLYCTVEDIEDNINNLHNEIRNLE